MGLVITMAKGMLKDAFNQQAKVNNKKQSELQIVIGLKKELKNQAEILVPAYYLMHYWNYDQKEEQGFKQLTGTGLIDLMNKEGVCKENFPEYIQKIAKDKNLSVNELEICIVPSNDKLEQLGVLLMHNKQIIKPITFEYFFKEEPDEIK